MKFTDTLAREYATLWDDMQIVRLEKSIQSTARRIVANRARYDIIQQMTNVPWFVVGIIHSLETGLRFDRHLHNGDPLTAATKLVPAGRPRGQGPFTFEQSCQDALCMKDYHKIAEWPVERIAWALENYNGWGYRRYRKILSPYLWSGSNHYRAGKYVADGKWSATAVSSQSGAMPLLKCIMDQCPDVLVKSMFDAAPDPEMPSPASNASANEGMSEGQKTGIAVGSIAGAGVLAPEAINQLAPLTSNLVAVKGNGQQLLSGVDIAVWSVPVILGIALVCYIVWANKK